MQTIRSSAAGVNVASRAASGRRVPVAAGRPSRGALQVRPRWPMLAGRVRLPMPLPFVLP
eukprot:359426-Chlamydomonas_euryale.AAC.1